jgi:hypothetical protein
LGFSYNNQLPLILYCREEKPSKLKTSREFPMRKISLIGLKPHARIHQRR